MQGLYKKVTKGHYPRIPKIFSHDLSAVIRALLQVNAANRPTCEQILSMPPVVRRMEKIFPQEDIFEENKSCLLKTIKFPPNILNLSERLPNPTYEPLPDERGSEFDRKGSKDDRSVKWYGSSKKNSLKGRGRGRSPAEDDNTLVSSEGEDNVDRADVQVDLSNISGVKRVEHNKRSHEKRSNSKKLL